MRRRAALQAVVAVLAAWAIPSRAQAPARIPIVAVPLIAAGPDDPLLTELRRGLSEQGYVDGKNIRIEYRSSEGTIERLPAVLRELIEMKVDVIVAGAAPIVAAAKEATRTIPIVMVGWEYDPVAAGFVASLSRPGGNVTGVYLSSEETVGKRLELIKELLPNATSVSVLYDSFGAPQFSQLERAAKVANLRLRPVEAHAPYDFAAAFKRLKKTDAPAAIVLFSPHFYVNRKALAEAALAQRLPTIFEIEMMVQAGGMIAYGSEPAHGWRRAGYFISRLLTGARASELPVEQPNRYRLVANLRTARAVGITIPESIQLRADEVIQ
jgi:putative ABC transport system substrate-binding protein